MTESLDKKIFDAFLKGVQEKKIISDVGIGELKRFPSKIKVIAEDWDLLVDKDCFPPQKEASDGKQD
jgi:hypothetical protein